MVNETPKFLPNLGQDRTQVIEPRVQANLTAIRQARESQALQAGEELRNKNTVRIVGATVLASLVMIAGMKAVDYNQAHPTNSPASVEHHNP